MKKATIKRNTKAKILFLLLGVIIFSSCVNQHPKEESTEIGEELKIVATSPAVAEILRELQVKPVAVADSRNQEYLQSFAEVDKVGLAMSPDLEKIKSIQPDYAFSPASLIPDLLPKYEKLGISYGFLNLNNVEGMFQSIADLGKLLHKEAQAESMINVYQEYIKDFHAKYQSKKSPKVLILMGLPGSYLIATENSYVGSLVKMAGGQNVYANSDKQFLTVNTEDMINKQADIILRTAHALPEEVQEMFAKEFITNDIWKHFEAVQSGKVYDLNHELFGMSANFNYQKALEHLGELFYEN